MKVLLAIVNTPGSGATSSLGFAVSMLRLQTVMQGSPTPLQAVLEVVPSLRAAVDLVAGDASFQTLVAISSHLAFSSTFVLRALASGKPFVAGVYPLPVLDWDRVKSKSESSERPEFRGNVYNVDAANAKSVGGGYMEVPAAGVEPGAVVLAREAVDAVAAKVKAGECVADADVPVAWGGPVFVDVDQQCANFGPVEFFGCVGARTVLRESSSQTVKPE